MVQLICNLLLQTLQSLLIAIALLEVIKCSCNLWLLFLFLAFSKVCFITCQVVEVHTTIWQITLVCANVGLVWPSLAGFIFVGATFRATKALLGSMKTNCVCLWCRRIDKGAERKQAWFNIAKTSHSYSKEHLLSPVFVNSKKEIGKSSFTF